MAKKLPNVIKLKGKALDLATDLQENMDELYASIAEIEDNAAMQIEVLFEEAKAMAKFIGRDLRDELGVEGDDALNNYQLSFATIDKGYATLTKIAKAEVKQLDQASLLYEFEPSGPPN